MQKNKNEEHTYLDYVEEAVVKYDSDGCLQYYNDKFKCLYSYTDSDLQLGVHFSELGKIDLQNGNVVTTEYLGAKEEYLAIKAKYRSDLTGSFTVQLEDGRFIKTTDRLLPDGGFISVQTDVTELKSSLRALEAKNIEAEDARAEAEAWLQVLERSPSATLLRDSSFIIRNASHGWTQLTGFSRDETIGREWPSFLVEEEQDRAQDARQEAQKAIQTGRDAAVNVWTLRTNSGAKLQVTIMGNAVAGPTAQEAMVVVSVTNITDLATQKALADTLLNRNAAMVISQSDDWKIQTCSDAWTNQLGYTREETVGHDLTEFMEPEDAMISKEFRETLKSQKASKNVVRNTQLFRTKAGELRQIELQSVVTELEKDFLNIITLVDVTDMMRTQHQLQMLVEQDELTGLYSRRGLKKRFSDGMRKKTAGVYIFDLDHFKSVNDSYGHEAGDALLSAMG